MLVRVDDRDSWQGHGAFLYYMWREKAGHLTTPNGSAKVELGRGNSGL
jgi:hypothetical protein